MAVVDLEIARLETLSKPVRRRRHLLGARYGAVRLPQLKLTGCVTAAEKDLAVEDRQVARSDTRSARRSIRAGDAGKLVRAGGRPVCHPQLRVTILIEAIEQHFVAEDRHVGRVQALRARGASSRDELRCAGSVPRPKPGEAVGVDAVEQHHAVKNGHVGRIDAGRRSRRADGQLLGSRARAIGHPQPLMARRVHAVEQNTAIEDGHVGRVDSGRRRLVDAGHLMGAGRRSVCRPEALEGRCSVIPAIEQDLAIVDGKVRRSRLGENPRRIRPGDIGQLYGASARAVGGPQTIVCLPISADEKHLIVKNRQV